MILIIAVIYQTSDYLTETQAESQVDNFVQNSDLKCALSVYISNLRKIKNECT